MQINSKSKIGHLNLDNVISSCNQSGEDCDRISHMDVNILILQFQVHTAYLESGSK